MKCCTGRAAAVQYCISCFICTLFRDQLADVRIKHASVINVMEGKSVSFYRVATNLESLEYSGISLNLENSWDSPGILCNLREKLYQNSSNTVRYLHKTTVDWVNRITMISGSSDGA